MGDQENEVFLILNAMQTLFPEYPACYKNFQFPASQFVIDLYGNLINKIYQLIATTYIHDPALFTNVVNMGDEEQMIYSIYKYICEIFFYLGEYDIHFKLSDLYCPSSKRTIVICKTLIMFLTDFEESQSSMLETESKVLNIAENEKEYFNNRCDMQKILSEKAGCLCLLKNKAEKLMLENDQIIEIETKVIHEHQSKMNLLLIDETDLNKKFDILKCDENVLLRLENEELNLRKNVIHETEIQYLKNSTLELQKQINELEEQAAGYENCLETKESELKAYEEILIKLNNLQGCNFSLFEKIHKLKLNIKDVKENVSLKENTNLELMDSLVKLQEKEKHLLENDMKKNEFESTTIKLKLTSKLDSIKSDKISKEEDYLKLQEKDKENMEVIKYEEKKLVEINEEDLLLNKYTYDSFMKVIKSVNSSTENVKNILMNVISE